MQGNALIVITATGAKKQLLPRKVHNPFFAARAAFSCKIIIAWTQFGYATTFGLIRTGYHSMQTLHRYGLAMAKGELPERCVVWIGRYLI